MSLSETRARQVSIGEEESFVYWMIGLGADGWARLDLVSHCAIHPLSIVYQTLLTIFKPHPDTSSDRRGTRRNHHRMLQASLDH